MKESAQKQLTNIIFVDDDSDDRELFGEAMSLIDPLAHIENKRDGEELMNYLATSPDTPDVIFLDLNMPRKNGKECLKELRADKKFDITPIVIFTTSLNPVDVQDTFSEGATFFMRKPNSFEELKQMLTYVLTAPLKAGMEQNKDKFVLNRALRMAQ